jgi:hypothetical protein
LVVKELSIADTKPYKKQLMGVFPGWVIYDFNGPIDLLKFDPSGLVDEYGLGY